MTAFVVKGDMLNSFINQFFAKPIDKAVYLPQQSKNPVTNHLIDTMIKHYSSIIKLMSRSNEKLYFNLVTSFVSYKL